MKEAKEVLSLQISRDHDIKVQFKICSIYLFGPSVIVVKRKEGRKPNTT